MKKRIFLTLIFSLLGTVLIAWAVIGSGVLQPLRKQIIASRANIVVTIATELEKATDIEERLEYFEDSIDIEARLMKEEEWEQQKFRRPRPPRPFGSRKHRQFEDEDIHHSRGFDKPPQILLQKKGFSIKVMRGPGSPMLTEFENNGTDYILFVLFPEDIDQAENHSRLVLIILVFVMGISGWILSRWLFSPLKNASLAMEQIAQGNLSHRVTDDIGPASQAFNAMADRVEALIVGQRQLIASISHELRTPLTRLRIQTELLEGTVSGEKLAQINEEIDELDSLVEIMLLSAKMEQGKFALRVGTVNIANLVLEALGKIDLEERYLKLDIEDELEIIADQKLLYHVICNLLSNISRYTPKDCTVSIKAYQQENNIVLVVSDTGEGVSDAFLQEIFEPFAREEKSRSKITGGLGLGLGFVKNVIEVHQGSITINHNQPQGLRVEIQLPLSQKTE